MLAGSSLRSFWAMCYLTGWTAQWLVSFGQRLWVRSRLACGYVCASSHNDVGNKIASFISLLRLFSNRFHVRGNGALRFWLRVHWRLQPTRKTLNTHLCLSGPGSTCADHSPTQTRGLASAGWQTQLSHWLSCWTFLFLCPFPCYLLL